MKKTSYLITAVCLIVLAVFGTAFYWYSWRPSQIIKTCQKEVTKDPLGLFNDNNNLQGIQTDPNDPLNLFNGKPPIDNYDNAYKNCLRKYGLEK